MQRYPLAWPTSWPRTESHLRRNPKFVKTVKRSNDMGHSWNSHTDISVADGTQRVLTELRKLGVQEGDAIISTNLKTRLDGMPRSDQPKPQDPGVAVYWQRLQDQGEGARKVLAIDAYNSVEGNLAAAAATLEAMRAIERHGGARILERAFTGFTALPAPGQTSNSSWRKILDMPEGEQRLTVAEKQYLALRSRYHPDKPTGNPDMFNLVQVAWGQAQTELGNPP